MTTKIPYALLEVSIYDALAIRQLVAGGINSEKLIFICPNCGEAVRPHAESKYGSQKYNPPHFEHLNGKSECELAYMDEDGQIR